MVPAEVLEANNLALFWKMMNLNESGLQVIRLPLGFTTEGTPVYASVTFSAPLRRGWLFRLARQLERICPMLEEAVMPDEE